LEYLDRLIELLRAMGAPGLFGLSFIDSAGMVTGGAPDLLILVLGADGRGLAGLATVVPAAVVGSTLGSLVLYWIGLAGGKRVLARFGPERQTWVQEQIGRYGAWATVVAVVAPPPYPMKPFVLAAGVFRMPLKSFVGAVLLGRVLRYGGVGYLAIRYGEGAGDLLRAHAPAAVCLLVGVICLGLAASWRRRRSRGEPVPSIDVSGTDESAQSAG
jgi:membrane protein YqaA with SNARE-associated domain